MRLVVNLFNKNLYQQVLFFVLPIYYGSATGWSLNFIFVTLLAISALLSTLDVVYDRHLSTRRSLTAPFFAFNLFAFVQRHAAGVVEHRQQLGDPSQRGVGGASFSTIFSPSLR